MENNKRKSQFITPSWSQVREKIKKKKERKLENKRKREEEEEKKEEKNNNDNNNNDDDNEQNKGGKEEKNEKEERTAERKEEGKTEGEEGTEKKEKFSPRRKVALLFAYSGEGYQGLQKNPGAKTIEDDLIEGLRKAGCLHHVAEGGDFFSKVNWTRAARTDKGVSAVGNVVGLKMMTDPEDTLVERINSHLPSAIKILKVYRTLNGFHAKNAADSRVYEYLIPTSALVPILENNSPSFTNERLERVRSVLKLFEGTHNFWNYTVSQKFEDSDSLRFMKSIVCGDPFIVEGTEFVKVTLNGASFMYNQIRKMMAMLIIVIRHSAPLNLIPNSFSKRNCPLIIAPGEFLLLDKIHFTGYNKKLGKVNPDKEAILPDAPGMEEKREHFKMNCIYPNAVKMEKEHDIMGIFVRSKVDHFKPVVDGVERDIHEWFKENRELYPDVKEAMEKKPKGTYRGNKESENNPKINNNQNMTQSIQGVVEAAVGLESILGNGNEESKQIMEKIVDAAVDSHQ